jgi:hypothetical protein
MNLNIKHSNIWLWFTVPIAILLAVAAGSGIFIHGLYRDAPSFAAQAEGQDLISLVVVLPCLIVTAWLARRGSPHARLIWLGALAYLVYSYTIAAFVVKYNPVFLVYVALLGCSLYALIISLVTLDKPGIKACSTEKTPVKVISIYLAVLAILFYFLWLSETVPALMAGKIPQSILDNGTPTNAVHVLDMAWILPAFGITAVSLWRKQALGYTLAGAMLSYVVLLTSAILCMVVFMTRDGQPVFIPQVVIFAVLFTISFGMLIWYMRRLKSPSNPN